MIDGDRFFFVDIETTGLKANLGVVLEVGIRIVDYASLVLIDEYDVVVWDSPSYERILEGLVKHPGMGGDSYVLDMHEKSGLWVDAQTNGSTPKDAQEELTSFLVGHGIDKKIDPMCGSSVQFDREWLKFHMPKVEGLFLHRNVDVSTVKELCRRMSPSIYARLDEFTSPKKLHRVIPDLEDTIEELGFYRDNFLWTEF